MNLVRYSTTVFMYNRSFMRGAVSLEWPGAARYFSLFIVIDQPSLQAFKNVQVHLSMIPCSDFIKIHRVTDDFIYSKNPNKSL